VIGKYRIVRDVGIGGMAQVFLAHREGPEGFAKPYVIKRILPQYSQDEQFAKMFITEAKVAALLDHPNIVHVFDFEIEDGNYYLVMEYVAGASLAAIVKANRRRGTPLGAQIAVEIGTAIAHALSYAHELTTFDGRSLDLVHRDISPGNVLVSRDGAVKLADFGVVKTSMTTTEVGVVNGKWAYMSPEQISGQPVDKRSDLFSLGIVLYELITGERLFRAENAAATASRVMNAPIPRLSTVVSDLDPRLDDIVMTMLDRDPRGRYQTAAALAADLEAVRGSPQFSGGSARLRTLVRTIFPEESNEPALGTSFVDTSRPILLADPSRPILVAPNRRPTTRTLVLAIASVVIVLNGLGYLIVGKMRASPAAVSTGATGSTPGTISGADGIAQRHASAPADDPATRQVQAQLRRATGLVALEAGEYDKALINFTEAKALLGDEANVGDLLKVTEELRRTRALPAKPASAVSPERAPRTGAHGSSPRTADRADGVEAQPLPPALPSDSSAAGASAQQPAPSPQADTPGGVGVLEISSPSLHGVVWVNGRPRGYPPLAVRDLPPGPAKVELRINGIARRVATAIVKADSNTTVKLRASDRPR
jgi:eukaryotic-like serine/threonine-protein kinase